jgi:hypothetical protein
MITREDKEAEQLGAESEESSTFYKETAADKELLKFIVEHTDRWRDYRDQNYADKWDRYERIFRGIWEEADKERGSERSRLISPATQQAIETRHAEIMEAIFGQGEFFDIEDDLADKNGSLDIEKLKKQLYEDFRQNKIRKSIDQITLMGEIYGTGIGEIVVEKKIKPYPMELDLGPMVYDPVKGIGNNIQRGPGYKEYVCVKLVPVSPKNFLFDPNSDSIDDSLGVAIERYVSTHKIAKGIADGKYRNVDITSMHDGNSLEPTQQEADFRDDKVKLLTWYGLVPREYLTGDEEEYENLLGDEMEDYADMVEAVVIIANDGMILKAEESPYMMKDRPVISYQADTMPNRLLGRGTAEKADNMQRAIDGSMRCHMDGLALTSAPMVAIDATRWPRGAKFQVQPGKALLTNGAPSEILMPFKFGTTDGAAMETSKEFERMLLMAAATIDSNGAVSNVARDVGMDMATATLIKKYKRTLVNFQEDFLIPFIYKAAWRYMQFDPERYPSTDMTFVPTAMLGIIAREHETKQLAFLIQTLGAQSPLTPILMQGILKNSGVSDRESMIEQMKKMSQPNPQQQQVAQQAAQLDMALKQAELQKTQAEAQKTTVEAQIAPLESKAKMISALSNNLDDDQEGKDFENRARLAELMLKEKSITSDENIARMQMAMSRQKEIDKAHLDAVKNMVQ